MAPASLSSLMILTLQFRVCSMILFLLGLREIIWAAVVCFVNREESIGADFLSSRDLSEDIFHDRKIHPVNVDAVVLPLSDILQSGGVLLQHLHTKQGEGEKFLQLCHSFCAVSIALLLCHYHVFVFVLLEIGSCLLVHPNPHGCPKARVLQYVLWYLHIRLGGEVLYEVASTIGEGVVAPVGGDFPREGDGPARYGTGCGRCRPVKVMDDLDAVLRDGGGRGN